MSVFDQQATRKPPISQIGAILWVRTNLFSSWINTALTAASIYLLYIMIPPLLDWMFFNASFSFGTINFFGFDIHAHRAIKPRAVLALKETKRVLPSDFSRNVVSIIGTSN